MVGNKIIVCNGHGCPIIKWCETVKLQVGTSEIELIELK